MPMRFQAKAQAIVSSQTLFTHGLTVNGLATAPDEWAVNLRGPGAGGAVLYVASAPTTTAIVVASSGAAATGDVFAWINHTIVE